MFEAKDNLKASAVALVSGESNLVANLANLSSLIYHSMPDLNWVGFYLWDEKDNELVLGPFQGKPACIRIKAGKGVCGHVYNTHKPELVPDVHAFAGHIACDSETNSELVIPIMVNGKCLGVLDLDSPKLNRFTQNDLEIMQDLVQSVTPLIFRD